LPALYRYNFYLKTKKQGVPRPAFLFLKLNYIAGVSGGGGGAIGPFGTDGPFFFPFQYQAINTTTAIAAITQNQQVSIFENLYLIIY